MIPANQAKAFIESKKQKEVTLSDLKKFSSRYQAFGKIILSQLGHYDPDFNEYEKKFLKFFELEFLSKGIVNPWLGKEGAKLALLFYGDHVGKYISDVWSLFDRLPYQSGYSRRAFRSLNSTSVTVNKLRNIKYLYRTFIHGQKGMNLFELIQYDVYCGGNSSCNCFIYAVALTDPDVKDQMYNLIKDIFAGEDEIGGVSRSLIKGLLLTEDPNNWKVVTNLLLAAQREEGLRQTILESLDECSVGALKHIIQVILDNDLMRFSSVVRAVDTWFGFGWDAPKKSTIKRILEFAILFIGNMDAAIASLESKDNIEVYVALWSIGLFDVDTANAQASSLLYGTDYEKQLLACMFASETQRSNSTISNWLDEHLGEDVILDFWVLDLMPPNKKWRPDTYQKLKATAEKLDKKGLVVTGKVFSWSKYTISPTFFYTKLIDICNDDQLIQLAADISQIPSDLRYSLVRKMFPVLPSYTYGLNSLTGKHKDIVIPKKSWKRELVYQCIRDKNEDVMQSGIYLFKNLDLGNEDFEVIVDLLNRKNRTLRESLIKLILQQDDSKLKLITSSLVQSSKSSQRAAGLEILTVLHGEDRMQSFIGSAVSKFKERKSISTNENIFLDKFKVQDDLPNYKNGFLTIDFSILRPLIEPKSQFDDRRKKLKGKGLLGKLMSKLTQDKNANTTFLFNDIVDVNKVNVELNRLIDLYLHNKDYEYAVLNEDGSRDTYILGSTLTLTESNGRKKPLNDQVALLPLADSWIRWYNNSQLNDYELLVAMDTCSRRGYRNQEDEGFSYFLNPYMPDIPNVRLEEDRSWNSISNRIGEILEYLYYAYSDHLLLLHYRLDVYEDMIANISRELKEVSENSYYSVNQIHPYWSHKVRYLGMRRGKLLSDIDSLTDDLSVRLRFWDLEMYLLAHQWTDKINHPTVIDVAQSIRTNSRESELSGKLTIELHKEGLLSDSDVQLQLLRNDNIKQSIENKQSYRSKEIPTDEKHKAIFAPLKKRFLELEIERGDLPTEATIHLGMISYVEGQHYLFRMLERMGRETFSRGYYWSVYESRKQSFSSLIKKCIPLEYESIKDFVSEANSYKVTDKKWIELAMYAPQWASRVQSLLKVDNLEKAIWWFHAHAGSYMSAEKETVVSRYSNIKSSDFQRGSIDIDWFYSVYDSIGKKNWKMLHDSAKYITEGNGHRLIKLYSSVLLGETKIRETLLKIKEKRDKDYLKVMGLVPLSKANRSKDLLDRYNLLQSFLKESKQFGSQRQESEKNAVEVGLINLARNAGYDDSIRFTWAMEGVATNKIMEESVLEFDDAVISLVIDAKGQAEIKVQKGEKSQKSIPAKYKKDKNVAKLKAHRTYLRRQYSRTRQSLEYAMTMEESFAAEEINKIMMHPVVKAMLSKLVLYNKEQNISGFWDDNALVKLDGTIYKPKAKDTFVIAHPSHLYRSVEWDLFQRHAFDNKLIQPFKQIFRELYVVTADEREVGHQSNRYQGHQIQPNKAAALLKARGWTVQYEEGLQRVYHKRGVVATMYAMADWFSPAEIEAPVLEFVSFYDTNARKVISMSEIDPVIFSEVMRDVDLVVSVAHVGGVDPEASHSTLQMREALAKESARLFKADNVQIKDRHILIQGKLSDYTIHLGSGIVKRNGISLSIIPVHSQHRGRMFLPFIDDDPKSAEIISKMKMLANDDKIKDPTILAQIHGK